MRRSRGERAVDRGALGLKNSDFRWVIDRNLDVTQDDDRYWERRAMSLLSWSSP
jgi:hypothetical protein